MNEIQMTALSKIYYEPLNDFHSVDQNLTNLFFSVSMNGIYFKPSDSVDYFWEDNFYCFSHFVNDWCSIDWNEKYIHSKCGQTRYIKLKKF